MSLYVNNRNNIRQNAIILYLEDLIITKIFNIYLIPRITNELHQKLYDSFPIVRFF